MFFDRPAVRIHCSMSRGQLNDKNAIFTNVCVSCLWKCLDLFMLINPNNHGKIMFKQILHQPPR